MKKIISSIMVFISFILIMTTVQAKASLVASISSTSNKLEEGQEVVLTLSFDNYQEIENGINAYKATLEYDENLFEQVTENNFTLLNGWSDLKYNPETKEFIAIKKSKSTQKEDIVKITFKAKENLNTQVADIWIKDIVASEGKEDIAVGKNNVLITIVEKEGQSSNGSSQNQEQNPNEKPGQNPEQDPEKQPEQNQTQSPEKEKLPTKIPKTGDTYIALFIIYAIEVLVVISFVLRKKIKNKKINKFYTVLFISIILSAQLVGGIYAAVSSFSQKGELNNDGKIDYSDVNLLELHLVNLELLPQDKLENADINSDGKITVTDLSLLIDKVEKKLNYEVEITDVEVSNYYVEKNAEVILKISANISYGGEISNITIDNNEYTPELEDNKYIVKLNVSDVTGINELKITKVALKTGQNIQVDYAQKIDILKDAPSITDYAIEQEPQNNQVNIQFDLIDLENAFISGKVQLLKNNAQIDEEIIEHVGSNIITFDVEDKTTYTYKIILKYARDNEKTVKVEEKTLLEEQFKFVKDEIVTNIELKDISNTYLYHKQNDGNIENVQILDIKNGIPTDLENYFIKIEMKELPTFYTGVKEFKKEDGKVVVIAKQSKFIEYEKEDNEYVKQDFISLEMPYIDENGQHDIVKKADDIFKEIAKDIEDDLTQGKTYTLNEDLDASNFIGTDSAIAGTFRGTFDGNGHKIINLQTGLFGTLNEATIKNVIIDNANIKTNAKGTIASKVENNTTIKNVHIQNSSIINDQSGVGGIVGEIKNSIIEGCSANEIYVKGNNTVGGIAGNSSAGTKIENCYVNGKIEGTFNHPTLGARAGGITGWDSADLINKCYTNVTIIGPSEKGNGGIIGGPDSNSPVITNCFSIANGKGYRISGFDVLGNASNVYEYSKGTSKTNINEGNKNNIKEIEDIYATSFYETLGFDGEIWNLQLVQNKKLPNLLNDPMPNDLKGYEIKENKNEIPNYEEIRNNAKYINDKEILYHNTAKLMPFADTDVLLELANSASNTGKMKTQKIKFILPLDSKGNLVVGIQSKDVNKIEKIRIVYEDETSQDYLVNYSTTIESLVATYSIEELNLKYQFDSYIEKIDDNFKNNLIDKAKQYDYENDIYAEIKEEVPQKQEGETDQQKNVREAAEGRQRRRRLYVDYYNETVKNNVEDIITKFIMTKTDYPTYCNNTVVQEQIQKDFTEEKLKQLLYSYNYYDKWYHINLDGVIISDLLFFDGDTLNEELTSDYLIDKLYSVGHEQRDTTANYTFYNNTLKEKTGKGLTDFLKYLIKTVAKTEDPSDWFSQNFEGLLYEQKANSKKYSNIKYRIWDMFDKLGDRTNIVLPILTAPQKDMYIISVPSQFIIGSMNRYDTYLTKDGEERDRMLDLMKTYAEKVGNFYGVSADLVPNSVEILNNTCYIQYDTRFNFKTDTGTAQTEETGTTQEPTIKWVYEAIGRFAAANGSAAYADGTNVFWVVNTALGGGDYPFSVFTHETAHNQDGKYFYNDAGRRNGTGAEAHADDNIAQDMADGSIVFNIYREFDITDDVTNNFKYERIDTEEKIKDYYSDVFDTSYVLEYLIGQAFLELTPEQKAGVAVQAANHTNSANNLTFDTTYKRVTVDEIKNMKLEDMQDLINNKLVLRNYDPKYATTASAQQGSYGWCSIYDVFWYQPFNDNGAPDTPSFKRLGKEMLSLGGYANGYITYMSGKSATDLEALRTVTGDPDITWNKYKLERYEKVKEDLKNIPYFDYKEVIEQFKEALITDSKTGNKNATTDIQRIIFGLVKRATNDFTDGNIYKAPSNKIAISSAEELISKMSKNTLGNYYLTKDIDFSGIEATEDNCYISNTFVGILDGKGYKITGVKYPLFKQITYAQIKDLDIEDSEYAISSNAYISINSKNSSISGINVKNVNLELPMVKNKTNSYCEFGTNDIVVEENKIENLQDFVAIGENEENAKKKYILTNNIDFSDYTGGQNCIVPIEFSGSINGAGHTLSGLENKTLFSSFSGKVENLKIENFTNNRANVDKVTAFANDANGATFSNMKFKNITLTGGHRTAVIIGTSTNCNFEKITVENANVTGTGYYVSAFVGRVYGGTIKNCYVEGNVTCNATEAGGISGAFQNSPIVENVIANVNITRKSNTDGQNRNNNGGFVGNLYNTPNIINCISIGNMTGFDDESENVYKFTGSSAESIEKYLHNCYEYQNATGTSSIAEDVDNLKAATEEQIKTKEFYKNTLKFSDEIWDFTNITTNKHPILKQSFK